MRHASPGRAAAAPDGTDSDDAALEEALESAMAGDAGLDDDYVASDDDGEATGEPQAEGADEPPSFSRVDLQQSDAEIAKKHPLFPVGSPGITQCPPSLIPRNRWRSSLCVHSVSGQRVGVCVI